MKKKPAQTPKAANKPEPLMDDDLTRQVIEQARLVLDEAKTKRAAKCGVCGNESAPNSAEDLCWVCRRLKISAWRDSDQQLPVQE